MNLNLKQVENIYKGCNFKHAIKKEKSTNSGLVYIKEDALEALFDVISKNKDINTITLNEKSPFSVPTTRKYVNLLLDSGRITKTVIGHVGLYERVVYNQAEEL